jgi:hypothetical protein
VTGIKIVNNTIKQISDEPQDVTEPVEINNNVTYAALSLFALLLVAISFNFNIPSINAYNNAAAVEPVEDEREAVTCSDLTPESEIIPSVPAAEEITSKTLWLDANTYAVGGDGHKLEVLKNSKAVDPTYQELRSFVRNDLTDEHPYINNLFVCADFSETVQHNAERAGFNCGFVAIDFTSGTSHMCNVFNTSDKGLVFIDCTHTDGPRNSDCKVKIYNKHTYTPAFMFPEEGWSTTSMGTVDSFKIYWD